MRSPPARVAATVLSIALLAAPPLLVPGRAALAAARCTLDRTTDTTIDPSPFLTGGYNVRWNAVTDRLAYMQTDANGFYRVFTMRADGSERRALSDGRPELPHKRSARRVGGKYTLSVADFVAAPEPRLQNIRTYQPGGGSYYEPGSFTSDSAGLTYASDQDTHSFWHSQIYRLDLASGESTRLTRGNITTSTRRSSTRPTATGSFT